MCRRLENAVRSKYTESVSRVTKSRDALDLFYGQTVVSSSLGILLPPLQAQLGTGRWWADASPLSAPVHSSLLTLQAS